MKTHRAYFAVVWIVVGLLQPELAFASPSICQKAYSTVSFEDLISHFNVKTPENPVQLVREEKSILGKALYLIKRVGRSWNSTAREFPNAIQGDPRMAFKQFGRKVAEYLGFEMISETEMLVPGVEHLNQALDRIDSVLPEGRKTRFRFFSSDPDSPVVGALEYLKAFTDNNLIPIASKGSTFIHDLSYHIASQLFPRKSVDHAQQTARLFFEFYEFAAPKLKKEFGRRGVEGLRFVADRISDNIDYSMGNFGAEFPSEINSRTVLSISGYVFSLAGSNRSSIQQLDSYIGNSFLLRPIERSNEIDDVLGDKRNVIQTRIENLYKRFIDQPHIQNSSYTRVFSMSHQEVADDVNQAKSAIEKAVQEIRP